MANIDSISESRWEWNVEGQQISILQNERYIVRKIIGIPPQDVAALLEILRRRVSVKNPEDSNQYYSVEDPLVAGIAQPGRWRQVNVRVEEGNTNPEIRRASATIIQTLAYGWVKSADSLPTPFLLSDEKALLSPFMIDTTSEKRAYVYEYRCIDPAYAETLRDTIELTSGVISAKVVDTKEGCKSIHVLTQTNTWAGDITTSWSQTDQYKTFAAHKITERYSHVPVANLAAYRATLESPTAGYKVSEVTDTAHDEGFVDLVQIQEKLFVGTVSASNGTLQEERYLSLLADGTIRTTMWLNVADADLATAMATAAVAPDGYRVLRVANNYAGTGSFTMTRTMVTKDTDPDEVQIGVQWPSEADEHRTYCYFGLDTTQAATLFTTLSATCDVGYKIDSVDTREWHDDMLMVTQVISKLFVGDVSAANGTLQETLYLSLLGTNKGVVTTMWLNVADDDLATAMTTVATPPSGYKVLRVFNNYNGTGSFNLIRVMVDDVTDQDEIQMGVTWPNFMDERRTYFYFGLTKDTATALLTTLKTDCDVGYKVDNVEIREWREDTLVVIQSISKLNTAFTADVRNTDYTRMFGLVSIGTTIIHNVAKASIDTQKAAIIADTDIIVLSIQDDDMGEGKANIVYVWRSKPSAPTALGAVRAEKISQFHQTVEDRQWFDVNIADATSLKTAVAAAMAASGIYAVAAGEEVQEATGEDSGDKTARVTQRVIMNDEDTPADYTEQVSFNPHGLREAVQALSIREYPEVHYTNLATIFTALQTFITDSGKMKGRIQVALNAGRLSGTFSMRGIKEGTPDWDNSTPAYVETEAKNKDLIGDSNVQLATGVPVAGAAAIVAAATADADHNLDLVTMIERDHGEAHIEKRQTKKYETAVQVTELPESGAQRAEKDYTWPLVLSANLATVWTAAETYGIAGNYVLLWRERTILPNGMYAVRSHTVQCTETTLVTHINGYTDRTVITTTKVRDAAALPTATDTNGQSEHIDAVRNIYNKYDYTKVIVAARVPKSCASEVTWSEWGPYQCERAVHVENGIVAQRIYDTHFIKYRRRYDHAMNFHLTAALAAAAITGGRVGSSFHQVSDYLWMSDKVTWTDDADVTIYTLAKPKMTESADGIYVPPIDAA